IDGDECGFRDRDFARRYPCAGRQRDFWRAKVRPVIRGICAPEMTFSGTARVPEEGRVCRLAARRMKTPRSASSLGPIAIPRRAARVQPALELTAAAAW